MLFFLVILLTIAHLLIIGFNMVAWVWKCTRKAHLVSVFLTAASWFVLGICIAWGIAL